MIKNLIDIEFSYNGNLGELQQRTIDNTRFIDRLAQNNIITGDEWREYRQKIADYFVREISKVIENPYGFISTI